MADSGPPEFTLTTNRGCHCTLECLAYAHIIIMMIFSLIFLFLFAILFFLSYPEIETAYVIGFLINVCFTLLTCFLLMAWDPRSWVLVFYAVGLGLVTALFITFVALKHSAREDVDEDWIPEVVVVISCISTLILVVSLICVKQWMPSASGKGGPVGPGPAQQQRPLAPKS